MQRSFRYMAFGILTASLIAGSSLAALADQESGGPGVTKPAEVSQEAPGVSGDTTNAGPGVIVTPDTGADSQGDGQGESQASGDDQSGQTQTGSETNGQAQESQTQESSQVSANQAFLQVQLLRPDMTWTDPIRDDTTILPGEGGFISMSIYANNLPGDVLYRTYSANRGWSNWAMNGGHTTWAADCPIEAVQIRLNGVFGNSFDV